MRTDTLSAFADELDKIAEVNLLGVSPEKVLTQQMSPPLETDGTRKAMSILDKAEMFKTASKKKDRSKPGGVMHHRLPMLGFLGATPSGVTPNGWDELKSTGAHGLAGAGVGRFISEFSSEAPTQAKKFKYTRAGLALGLADNVYKRHRKRKAKKTKTAGTLGLTPGQALKAGRQVGTHSGAIKSGPSIKSQIRGSLVGRRGALPF